MTENIEMIKNKFYDTSLTKLSSTEFKKQILILSELGNISECEKLIKEHIIIEYLDICSIIYDAVNNGREKIWTQTKGEIHYLSYFSYRFENIIKYYNNIATKIRVQIPENLAKLTYDDYIRFLEK